MEKKNNKASLAELRPDLVAEWDFEKNGDLRPEQVTAFSLRKVWWKCSRCGQSWASSIEGRVQGCSCPWEARMVWDGCSSKLVAEWDAEGNGELNVNRFFAMFRRKVWWVCSCCGHRWQMAIYSRVQGKGCPLCKKDRAE